MERIQDSSKQRAEVLAARANTLVRTVNQLIADIESDVSMPSDAAFHAKDSYAGLCRAHNALLDEARGVTSPSILSNAKVADIERRLSDLHRKAASPNGTLTGGLAGASINGHEVTLQVSVSRLTSPGRLLVKSTYEVDGNPVAIPDLTRVISGAALAHYTDLAAQAEGGVA